MPVVSESAAVLILGSMPSEASLLIQQYYGHSRNAFWPIMSGLFNSDSGLCYQQRKELLLENGIAVWDVLQGCKRLGSLDSNIQLATIRTNNFTSFFSKYKSTEVSRFFGSMNIREC